MSQPAARIDDVASRLAEVRSRVAAAARAAGRDPAEIALIAVSKGQPDERIAAALEAGQRRFGENRVQEAERHWSARRDGAAALELHLIGPLQTNKLRDALALFDALHTLDRPRLAEALARERDRGGRCPPCFVEVNTGEEPQKAGVLPAAADAFIRDCRERLALPVVGLMCVPPFEEAPAPHFALLREIARRHDLAWLSMGMSADFETAIAFGATHLRVGTAIFGPREPRA